MKEKAARISSSELEVLKILWTAEDGMSFSEIRGHMKHISKWKSSTIKTLLRRLNEKEIVAVEKKAVYYYRALISETEYNEFATLNLVNQLYAGSARSLVASLVNSNKLNKDDIEELRAILDRAGDKNDSDT